MSAAASARLCVETPFWVWGLFALLQPPPRGCVLKHQIKIGLIRSRDAAASARLCVETANSSGVFPVLFAAASARLCVETSPVSIFPFVSNCSRLRAAVC